MQAIPAKIQIMLEHTCRKPETAHPDYVKKNMFPEVMYVQLWRLAVASCRPVATIWR